MTRITRGQLGLITTLALTQSILAGDEPQWVEPMRAVHANTRGEQGTLLHLGDSITYSMAYFAPLQYAGKATMTPATRDALNLVDDYMKKDCYRWKGRDKGNYSGQTASWGLKNADRWIGTLKPEVAVIMFGSNDIRRGSIEAHERNLRALIQKCLDRGVVVILSTIPPMHNYDDKVRQTVEIQRKIADEMKVPLIDLYAHVINRRPNDWDGTLKQFESYSKWEVPTLISSDGVHFSNPKQWSNDYTEEGLVRNGCVLRSYLTLMAYAEVINVVIRGKSPSTVSTTILGANPAQPVSDPEDLKKYMLKMPEDYQPERKDARIRGDVVNRRLLVRDLSRFELRQFCSWPGKSSGHPPEVLPSSATGHSRSAIFAFRNRATEVAVVLRTKDPKQVVQIGGVDA